MMSAIEKLLYSKPIKMFTRNSTRHSKAKPALVKDNGADPPLFLRRRTSAAQSG